MAATTRIKPEHRGTGKRETSAADQTRPTSELLPWLFMSESRETVINKDSSLLAVFAVRGIDIESADRHGLEDSAKLHDAALRELANLPVTVWHRIDRYAHSEYPYGEFSNPMAAQIDRIWGETFDSTAKSFESTASIAFGLSTARKKRAMMDMAREGMDQGASAPKAFAQAIVDRFKGASSEEIGFATKEELDNALARFEQNVVIPMRQKMHHLDMERLTDEFLCGYLKFTTSASNPQPVEYNPLSYMDAALSDTWIDNSHRDYLVLNGSRRRFAAVLSLKSAPPGNVLGRLNKLVSLPVELTIASAWQTVPSEVAKKQLKAARTFDELSRMDIKSLLRSAMQNQSELLETDSTPTTKVGVAAEAFISGIKSSEMAFGFMACTIIVYADTPDALKNNVEAVETELANSRLVFLREREGALSAYAVAIPGNLIDPIRWFHVEAGNVTDLAPLVSLYPGDREHPHFGSLYGRPVPPNGTFRTRWSSDYHFNNHVGPLGHTLIVGPSRNGKTMMQMFLESQLLKYRNATVINFDKDFSTEAPTLLHGGAHLDLTPGSSTGLKMNPLAFLKSPGGVSWCASWIDRLMTLRGARLDDKQMDIVTQALQSIAGVPNARLSTLRAQLPDELKMRLAYWCEDGMYGEFFDHPDDELSFETITSFELGGLMARNSSEVLRAFTDYVFFRIQERFRKLEHDIGPTCVYFEESGFLLEDPIFEERAVDYLMTLAKMQAYLTMTAQSPEAFARSQRLRAAVRDNVATIILLPNPAANRGDLAKQYKEVFGLNDQHLDLVANAKPKREYCIWQPQREHFRVMVAHFPPGVVARLRSDLSSRKVLNECYDQVAPWQQKYIDAVMAL